MVLNILTQYPWGRFQARELSTANSERMDEAEQHRCAIDELTEKNQAILDTAAESGETSLASGSHLDLIRAPYVLHGVNYTDPVPLGTFSDLSMFNWCILGLT